jgi:hypothetical protein
MRYRLPILFAVLILASIAVPPVIAQETTGTIIGTVTDASGGVLPGVTITVRHLGTGQTVERITSAEGLYTVPLLPVGAYEVSFNLSGFQPRVVRGLILSVNDRIVVDAQLAVGGVSEVVEVTSRSLVQPIPAVQALVDSTRVMELPINNRNFVLLAKLAPGVADLPVIAAAARDAGACGVTVGNTVRALLVDAEARRPLLGGPGGGLSGPAIRPIALRAIHDVHTAHPDLPVLGTGGISTGLDAVEALLAGASAVGVGTATFAEPRATMRVLDELVAWCTRHGVRAVRELTGAMRDHDTAER